MTNIDSEGGLGIDLGSKQWTPVYFKTENEAKEALKVYGYKAIPVYFTETGNGIYHEADKNRFVIFVQERRFVMERIQRTLYGSFKTAQERRETK